MKFSFLDVFLVIALGFSMFMGYRGGFTKKVLTLLALIGSVVLSLKLMHPIGDFLQESGILGEPICFIVAFAIVIISVMGLVTYLYHKFGNSSGTHSGVSIVGILFGLIEGLLILSLLLLGLKFFNFPSNDFRKESILYRPVLQSAPRAFELLKPYLPGAAEFRTELSTMFKGINIDDVLPDPAKK